MQKNRFLDTSVNAPVTKHLTESPFGLTSLKCEGREKSLEDCKGKVWGKCKDQVMGVVCSDQYKGNQVLSTELFVAVFLQINLTFIDYST